MQLVKGTLDNNGVFINWYIYRMGLVSYGSVVNRVMGNLQVIFLEAVGSILRGVLERKQMKMPEKNKGKISDLKTKYTTNQLPQTLPSICFCGYWKRGATLRKMFDINEIKISDSGVLTYNIKNDAMGMHMEQSVATNPIFTIFFTILAMRYHKVLQKKETYGVEVLDNEWAKVKLKPVLARYKEATRNA